MEDCEVLRGKPYVSPMLAKDTFDYRFRQGIELIDERDKLSHRQREVLQLLAEGKRMKEVGRILKITHRTVAFS